MKRQKTTGFRPVLEALQDRTLPACLVSLNATGTTLTIIGDSTANVVRLEEDDGANILSVWCDGVPQTFASLPITRINIKLGHGDDELSYGLARNGRFNSTKDVRVTLSDGNDRASFNFSGLATAPPLQGTLKITLNAGLHADRLSASFGQTLDGKLTLNALMNDGNDTVGVGLSGTVTANGKVRVDVDGGAHKDRIRVECVDYGSIPDEFNDLDIASGGSVRINALGGSSKDVVLLTFGGELDGFFSLLADGGTEVDLVELREYVDAGSTGNLDAQVLGDTGNDALLLEATDNSGGAMTAISLLLDGGADTDTWTASPNVTVTNCP
jgi:hypothetical protein